jgi:hypothetical protein
VLQIYSSQDCRIGYKSHHPQHFKELDDHAAAPSLRHMSEAYYGMIPILWKP